MPTTNIGQWRPAQPLPYTVDSAMLASSVGQTTRPASIVLGEASDYLAPALPGGRVRTLLPLMALLGSIALPGAHASRMTGTPNALTATGHALGTMLEHARTALIGTVGHIPCDDLNALL
ncbi:MAG: hypothetical protein Q8N17_21340, partial [Burkholderiaceae bacterium]|nr:hypothetical protein [Burkholderiaceae bacterium]